MKAKCLSAVPVTLASISPRLASPGLHASVPHRPAERGRLQVVVPPPGQALNVVENVHRDLGCNWGLVPD